MTTAFVMAGGANLGALQVGMLQALVEAGERPDLIVGTSVGALNGAWIAGEYSESSIARLAETWGDLRRSDVFPLKFTLGLRGFIGRNPSLFDASGLRDLLERNLMFDRLEDASIPVAVVATDVLSGADVAFDSGDAVEAVLASSAIPGVLPPVSIDGRLYMDGGVANNAPLSHAIERGATRVFILTTGYDCPLEEAPTSVLGMMLQALSTIVDKQLVTDIERYQNRAELIVVPSPCPLEVTPGDFSHTAELIEHTYELTVEWIADGGIPPASRGFGPVRWPARRLLKRR